MISGWTDWLGGAEVFTKLSQEEDNLFAAECAGVEKRKEDLRNDEAQLEQTRLTLETQPSPLSLAKERLRSLENSTDQYGIFLVTLTDHMNSVGVKLLELDKEDARLTHEIEELKQNRQKTGNRY